MIQRNELRAGNILINPLKDNQFFVIRTGADIDSIYQLQNMKGYPVSVRLLEKCGFKRTVFEEQDALRLDLHVSVGYSLSMIYFPGSDAAGVMLFNNASPVGEMEYEYLHQIQNVYFTLTGEELPINL